MLFKLDTIVHGTIIGFIIVFASILIYFSAGMTNNSIVAISLVIILSSVLISFILFKETAGILFLFFVISLVAINIFLNDLVHSLFLSSLILVFLVCINILKH